MGRIQSNTGLITGIDIQGTVDQLMNLNAISRDRLQTRIAGMQSEQAALTGLMTQIVGVQLTTDRLGQSSLFSSTSVSSGNTQALTARSSGNPKPGSYTFVPVRLAQSQQQTSSLLASGDQKLSQGEVVIHTGGFLDQSLSLDQFNGGKGVARGSIRISDRSGVSQSIDLRFAQTASDVVDAINSNDKLNVVASLEGDHFVLKDVSGSSTGNLTVSDLSGGTTALDLGLAGISSNSSSASGNGVVALSPSSALRTLLDGRGMDLPKTGTALKFDLQDGTSVDFSTQLNADTDSLGKLIDEINTAGAGKLSAKIAADGKSLEFKDLTSGSSTFAVSSPAGTLATQLGLDTPSSGGVISSQLLVSGLSDTLLSSLNGGSGLGALGQISITDRSGNNASLDLSTAKTLDEVIQSINAAPVGVKAQLNRTKTGIELIDNTGSTANQLVIANADATNSASKLKIEGSVDTSSIDSGSLSRQFVARNTSLKSWNQGTGLTLGSIKLTDSSGKSSTLNLNSVQPQSVGDVIDAINKIGLGIEARINEAGDGLLLVDTAGGTGTLAVADVGNGQTAQQLGIAGSGASLTVGNVPVTGIDGSRTIRIATTNDTTVSELAEQINALSGGPVNASLLNVSGGAGVRLQLNSSHSGQQGRVALSGNSGLSFSETAQARDALLAFGANETNGGVLVSSSSNTFRGVVEDVEFTIATPSTTPITVTVNENRDNIAKQVSAFVDQYNNLRTKFDDATAFDSSKNSVGVLFGKTSALRVDMAYGRFLSGRVVGAGSIQSLGQLGISLNDKGKLEFDQTKFTAALEADPGAVEEFFTKEDTGFSAKAKALADSLAGIEGGALLTSSNSLQSQIEQSSKRVDSMNTRLDKQRERLLKQFYSMEAAISKLQQNSNALSQLQIIPPLGST
ncbi:MAG: flagellar filament capping protein FliD [Pirellulaceae bacterium]|jgi:flagellar hook-associated protein 2|nr:flagellar filament capping protein FliD [Pirellulaceae bacterium]